MNSEIKKKWVAALRSGDYIQGKGRLKFTTMFGNHVQHCCLGVLCEIYFEETKTEQREWDANTTLTPRIMKWAGISDSNGDVVSIGGERDNLAAHNDKGVGFDLIANAIETQL